MRGLCWVVEKGEWVGVRTNGLILVRWASVLWRASVVDVASGGRVERKAGFLIRFFLGANRNPLSALSLAGIGVESGIGAEYEGAL